MTKLMCFFAVMLIAGLGLTAAAAAQNACSGVNLEAGPIWNNADAQQKCPEACGNYTWNGQWRTTVEGQMSVCGCVPSTVALEAGPIWGNDDAPNKCRNTCGNAGRKWTGQWWTTVQGRMSVCQCACTS